MSPVSDADRFTVLMVCTANICRSPVAEALVRRELGETADVDVSSAGLSARVGEPVWDVMADLAGVPLAAHRARQVTADLVRSSGVVLTMTREQRGVLVERFPVAVRRTFTLREFGELAALALQRDQLTADAVGRRLAEPTALAPRLRAYRSDERDDDVADPYGRSEQDVRLAVSRIGGAVDHILRAASPACAGRRTAS